MVITESDYKLLERQAAKGLKLKPQPIIKQPQGMNKTELRYNDYLEGLKLGGVIVDYRFEAIKLKLAKATFYTPDFLVVKPECFEFHEVKGFMREDAAVKIKTAAELFPWFDFWLVRWKDKKWLFAKVG